MIPITTKEQFYAAKQAAEQMTEIDLFGAIYLVRGVEFDTYAGRGKVDVIEGAEGCIATRKT
jgi:hypothetical protein